MGWLAEDWAEACDDVVDDRGADWDADGDTFFAVCLAEGLPAGFAALFDFTRFFFAMMYPLKCENER